MHVRENLTGTVASTSAGGDFQLDVPGYGRISVVPAFGDTWTPAFPAVGDRVRAKQDGVTYVGTVSYSGDYGFALDADDGRRPVIRPDYGGTWEVLPAAPAPAEDRSLLAERLLEANAQLYAVAKALHPHWTNPDGNCYVPDQLAGMVHSLRKERDGAQAKLAGTAEERDRLFAERNAAFATLAQSEACYAAACEDRRKQESKLTAIENALYGRK